MTPDEFIKRWRDSPLNERQGSQPHFLDLCALLGEAPPHAADSTGETFVFEKGAMKTTGGAGWADVWKRGCFAWEYKAPRGDLRAAFAQLQRYAVALDNPPLLIVSDRLRIEIHTNWTNSVAEVHEVTLEDLRDANKRQLLKWAFSDPERLKPKKTRDEITEEAAGQFAELAKRLRERRHEPQKVAHFVNRLVFCMFAEDIELLPKKLFSKMLEAAEQEPGEFQAIAASLFKAMRKGGRVDFTPVEWFNGGLFDDDEALSLDARDIKLIRKAAELDWTNINPAILGTLFERGLDPDKRSQLGAHYTDQDKIMMIVEPVIQRPLIAEWAKLKAEIEAALGKATNGAALARARTRAKPLIDKFLDRLKKFRVLDPACGSGNFLYVALQVLKDLEHRVNLEAEVLGFPRRFPEVGPQCVKGIEINPFAAELARVSIWIGEIQWMRRNGFDAAKDPILKPLDAIECRDAILSSDNTEPTWPKADVIVGNPPFKGGKLLRDSLGADYVERLFRLYDGRVPAEADLVCYWFEKARIALDAGAQAVGLVSTNSIRGGANREALKRAIADHPIFAAWSDEPWVVDGAAVRVSLCCFGAGSDALTLDGKPVARIHPDLTSGSVDITKSTRLKENLGVAFMGDTKGGAFDVPGDVARAWLALPLNPNRRPNSDVLKPWINGMDVTRRSADKWIIDFGWTMNESDAALYEAPFAHIKAKVWPERKDNNRDIYRINWWRHVEPRPGMWEKLRPIKRYIATPTVAKFRVFVWRAVSICPDHQLIVIARDDDTTFGILQSRWHELWALRMGTSLEDRPRYTPSTTFETFPFPKGMTPDTPANDYGNNPKAKAIASAARKLNELREAWLNPPDLVVRVQEAVPSFPDRLEAKDDAAAATLKKRTLTNLYNDPPHWLVNAHATLDATVAAAYGWPADLSDDDVLTRLFELNQARAAAQPS